MKLTQEILIDLYINQKLSIKNISKLLNISVGCVFNNLKKFNIKTRKTGEILKNKYQPGEHYNCGKKASNDTRRKQSLAKKGKKMEAGAIENYKKSWTQTRKQKQVDRLKGKPPKNLTHKGYNHSEEHRKRMSERFSGENNPMFGKVGINNPCWVEPEKRKTSLYNQIRNCYKMNEWRCAIFKRDNYTCVLCSKHAGILHADHIKQFAVIIFENNIKTLHDALDYKELWLINNGRTLCVDCHKNTETYCKKVNKNNG
jgi:predicted DNA-binding protein YlxM (UPF0122 family)